VTDTAKYAGSEATSTIQLDIRDGATEVQRQNAQRSVEALLARSVDATARRRSYDDAVTKLTDAVNAPLAKLINDDPGANAALDELSTRPLLGADDVVDLSIAVPRNRDDVAVYSFAVGPPYDFAWSFHEDGGYAPHNQILNRDNGQVALDARSGSVPGGKSGWVKAHCGFGIFLPASSGQKYPHAVLNPGEFSYAVGASGISGNATSEGGFDLAIFEDGRYLTGANIKLWRVRVSSGEDSHGGQPSHLIAGPELQFTMQAGRTYTFNAGIWAYSDRTNGIGSAGAQARLQGMLTKMWSFGY
jgi:hypothetical protein